MEIFQSTDSGSGQIEVDSLPKEFDWETTPPHPDLALLKKLSVLSSYDVYSLRLLLRDLEIPTEELKALSLSESKKAEMTVYMKDFTRPLISQIYGEEDKSITDLNSILSLFRDPDVEKAREKLQVMADQLNIKIAEIPKFLEDYGDIYLSLSYFKKGLRDYETLIESFLDDLNELTEHVQLKNDIKLVKGCNTISRAINHLITANKERFLYFEKYTKNMWDDITAEKFHDVESSIKSYHTTIGGGLCALSVKMNSWSRLFPNKRAGGPIQRSDFIMSDMIHGIDKILTLERQAPLLPDQAARVGQPPKDNAKNDANDSNDAETGNADDTNDSKEAETGNADDTSPDQADKSA